MTVQQITDHEAQALARLASQFREKVNLEALVGILAGEVQELEDATYALILGRTLYHATGATLERWGDALNRPRPVSGAAATDDEAYRALLLGQVVANSSSGTPEDVLSLFRTLGATAARYGQPVPAAIAVTFSGDLVASDPVLLELLKLATGPVAIDLVVSAPEGYFGFAADPDALGYGEGELSRVVT